MHCPAVDSGLVSFVVDLDIDRTNRWSYPATYSDFPGETFRQFEAQNDAAAVVSANSIFCDHLTFGIAASSALSLDHKSSLLAMAQPLINRGMASDSELFAKYAKILSNDGGENDQSTFTPCCL
jgi:hypothetical protein